MSWSHLSDKKVSLGALLISIGAYISSYHTAYNSEYKEQLNCPTKIRTEITSLQESIGTSISKMYLCADDPSNQCDFARRELKTAIQKIKNINEVFHFEELDTFKTLLISFEDAYYAISGKNSFLKTDIDEKADSLMTASIACQQNLNEKIKQECSWTAFSLWNGVPALLLILSICYLLALLLKKNKQKEAQTGS